MVRRVSFLLHQRLLARICDTVSDKHFILCGQFFSAPRPTRESVIPPKQSSSLHFHPLHFLLITADYVSGISFIPEFISSAGDLSSGAIQ